MQATTTCPDLYCPFPQRLHPLVNEADAHTTAWVHTFRLATSDTAWEAYHEQKFTWMVARMFPEASLFSLCIASDFNTLLFLWDDHLDALAPNAFNTGFERMAHHMMQILETGKTFSLETGGPLLAAMSDIWQRMRQISQRPWQARFARSLKEAFTANLWRMKHVDKAHNTSLKDYMRFRPQIGGANFFLDLATLMGAIRLPADLRSNPQVKNMGLYCSRTICWANDLYSFPKEYEGGDELNLVMLLKHHQQLTLDQAVEQAVKIHNSEVALFNNTADVLSAVCAAAVKPVLEQYVLTLGQMMKGNIDWSTQDTTRYQYVYA
ncbi:terpene synthase family protein [Chitinophaga arvensicola]|uniref:Terpene synthase n=1 Tax=Chitinophaga arvensicola TaxID=29529 RepID=A0A1I0RMY0_9BACT|nr:hypothetical protein [Chitinophaga arvensicola]SEW42635.1 hypothetical protein SAMN04488122_3126 [Chitinophaga arvensicola]